ncbi:MAG: translation elongation factor 4 [Planctomycetota bacterium]
MKLESLRNFSIIAHIDHGKSTLADRILLRAEAITMREFRDQVLDDMDLERERGITIKAKAVALNYKYGGTQYTLNLIDTPGHVDFHYEVSRSLAACEGALLLVDAAQGVEAQTVANFYKALASDLVIIPVLNKIDLAQARSDEVIAEMKTTLDINPADVLRVSAKTGAGVEDVFRAIIERVPPPKGDPDAPPRALVFDSVFNDYRGVIVYVRMVDGMIEPGQEIRFLKSKRTYEVTEVGVFTPTRIKPTARLAAGQVGYLIASIRTIHDVKIGDTVAAEGVGKVKPLPGYAEPQAMVFCGLYPGNNSDFQPLREALDRLSLNDSSFRFEPESSKALGLGFRCGFLGLLHMEIVQERLERESDVEVVQTAPNVTYEVLKHDGSVVHVHSPEQTPPVGEIKEFREPIARANLIIPAACIGAIIKLAEERRGEYVRTEYLSPTRVILTYDLPLAEIVYDFYDRLKSGTKGYGTMDYDIVGFKPTDLVKLDILVAGDRVDALSTIVHRSEADRRGRALVKKLRGEIDRHLFEVVIQAAIGSKIIARDSIPALAKHVTGKCYGGDITRKRKLWAKQREGKKRLKSIGRVEIPQEAFLAVLSVEK